MASVVDPEEGGARCTADITDRVRDYVAGTTIDVAESNLPSGKHTVEIQISDTGGNRSQKLFTVTVN